MIPTPRKIMIKKDRKVVFPNITVSIPRRSPDMVSPVETTVQTLKAHFLLRNPALSRSDMPLDEVSSLLCFQLLKVVTDAWCLWSRSFTN